MTEKKEFPNHEEPSESISPKFTAEAVAELANKLTDAWIEESKNTSLEVKVNNLAANVFLNQAIILQLQEAIQVRHENYEKSLEGVTYAAEEINQIKLRNAIQVKAFTRRLEDLES